ncbi:tRNA uridine-5-carboxymethylaminomethyl(34) synthesis GTPase MnmE [Novosphingobium sp. P6W]|uniref:tRNA uridine-5-carboxymethylaminomethyl(34) synthesis GTPase MnmE n=1 Tax=Novosphingobium sp. P6W TaxID=1609758 RepID=UPI0005C2DFEC|nr:tRNA uridine-5-carboxymethylaminomethyl(34) synthesis GTPase MnmE [Novosphingobium sp. P6W]AXB75179.1 tRNA uridine-5-carboxymethylaminomethyl(34) synthesis GTPase MnmE [Novosphingobium sp. P6W]KIS32763.1 tRNA modification GTPase TrmE [Novosphingobium sp. P6W]
MTDTIFALSSGSPPAAIAVVRLSGPHAAAALSALAGSLPEPRRASYRTLRVPRGTVLDRALVLWFPGPRTATGEDLAELHLHGGRAVVAAVETALSDLPGMRRAQPGEFTRRAFANGQIDLSEAEGLADLLSAETELQRRSAIAMAGGAFSEQVKDWRGRVLTSSAAVEAVLDFGDEDDVSDLPPDFALRIEALADELSDWLSRPRAEALREGYRVVLAGPPNAGKSTLFNALVEDEAAITAPLAGTTRDVLTRAVAIEGMPFLFADTAGLRDETTDVIEAIGIDRARAALDRADLVLWLGAEGDGPDDSWEIAAQVDRSEGAGKVASRHAVSAVTGEGLDALRRDLVKTARQAMPRPGDAALNARQHGLLAEAEISLRAGLAERDPLLVAECLRRVRVSFDALIGRATTEDMLDTLFGRFCIGK